MQYKDAHERDHALLEERASNLQKQNRLFKRSQALIFLFLCHKFHANDDDITDSYTDGGNDLGIDAIYIDTRPEDPVIHLIQSKFHESLRKAAGAFKYRSLDDISRFFDVLKDRDLDIDKVCNFRLQQKVQEIRDLQDRYMLDYKIWLVSNGNPPIEHEIAPVRDRLSSRDVTIENFHLHEMVDLCIERRNVHEVRTFYAREEGLVRLDKFGVSGAMGLISAQELYELVRDKADHSRLEPSIFDVNVRSFLGFNNDINKSILSTATSKNNRIFWALNNGVTMIGCDGKIDDNQDRPKVRVKNLSIVNGAQTCSAIFQAIKDYQGDYGPFKKLSIAFRIFLTDDPEFISQISTSTNTQNRISARDLKANDIIQKRIENEIREHGIQYLRKRGEFSKDNTLLPLDAMKAGQIILSYQLQEPDRAKRESDSIFSSDYHRIFNKYNPITLARGFHLYNLVWNERLAIEDEIRIRGSNRVENDFVTYGTFHILALCGLLESQHADLDDKSLISRSIDVIGAVLRKHNYPAYYSFFRNAEATKDILQEPVQADLFPTS